MHAAELHHGDVEASQQSPRAFIYFGLEFIISRCKLVVASNI